MISNQPKEIHKIMVTKPIPDTPILRLVDFMLPCKRMVDKEFRHKEARHNFVMLDKGPFSPH